MAIALSAVGPQRCAEGSSGTVDHPVGRSSTGAGAGTKNSSVPQQRPRSRQSQEEAPRWSAVV